MSKKKDKYALITGANGGIGQALCEVFTQEGYKVIATDIQELPIKTFDCYKYVAIDLNQFVESEIYANEKIEIIKSFLSGNCLNTLINNAAIQILGGVDGLTRNDWSQTLNINLQAPFLFVQAFVSELERAKGSVVNISSIHAKLTKKNFVAYATSKAALSGMTRAMAVDLGPRVRVNAVEPAAVETEMLKESFVNEKEKYYELEKYHPIRKIVKPKSLAKLVLFITDHKAIFIHGSSINIDGGISATLHDPIG